MMTQATSTSGFPDFRTSGLDVLVVVGEPSGDIYGGAIVAELRRRHPSLRIAAMGGPALKNAGADIIQGIDGLAVMGFIPVLKRLPEFMALGKRMAEQVRVLRPRVVLTIDYPGFNLRLVKAAKRDPIVQAAGTRFVHLVAPQVWAWRPRRAKHIAHTVDRLLCFFPFEPSLFARFDCQTDFVGHPLLDLIPPRAALAAELDTELGLAPTRRVLLLAPGSREREITTLLPLFDQVAKAMQRRHQDLIVLVGSVRSQPEALYRRFTNYPLVPDRYRALCARAHAALIASGTATLEAALLELPHVIAYRTDKLQGTLARHLIIAKHVGLPNIVADERIIPEVLQDQLDAPRLLAHLERLWDGVHRIQCLDDLANVRRRLGAGGALSRIADIIASEAGCLADDTVI
jgi:lipid-A-disaccharide synthase